MFVPPGFASPLDCNTECGRLPVRVGVCRHSESVSWAYPDSNAPSFELVVYNNGGPVSPKLPASVRERRIPNVGLEAFCHTMMLLEVKHVARQCGEQCVPGHIFLLQGNACVMRHTSNGKSSPGSARYCRERVLRITSALARGAHVMPRGHLVPLQPAETTLYANDYSRSRGTLACWHNELNDLLLDAPKLAHAIMATRTSGELGYSAGANYIVERETVLSTPAAWLSHLAETLLRSRPLPWTDDIEANATTFKGRFKHETLRHQTQCCNRDKNHTCLPWLLERFWPLMLGPGGSNSTVGVPPACHDKDGARGDCQYFEGNFKASLDTWNVRRHTTKLNGDDYATLVDAADANQLESAVEAARPELQSAFHQKRAQELAPCNAEKVCRFKDGSLKFRSFNSSKTKAYFAAGAGWACLQDLANASLIQASLPHVLNVSIPPSAELGSFASLRRALHGFLYSCLENQMQLLPASSPQPDMWQPAMAALDK